MTSENQSAPKKPRGAWAHAAYLAEMTPESRNRYVDFLRAASILAVVTGHWMMAAPHFSEGGDPRLSHMLDVSQWTQWLTWLLQVMPVFFFVGGFSNGTSWNAALRKKTGYAVWLDSRLRRLIGPVFPLLVVWAVMVVVARWQGVSDGMIRIGSKVALVPVWFLAVYMLVIVFVPLSYRAWK
jgi:fucose 4-O-acetylase-like acetyltransferase